MILRIFPLENEIKFNSGEIQIVKIFNKKYYSKLLSDIQSLCEGLEISEKIVLEDQYESIDFEKNVCLILDYYNFDYNNKKILNALYQHIENSFNFDTDKNDYFWENFEKMRLEFNYILNDLPFDVEQKEKIDIKDYFKIINLKIQKLSSGKIIDRVINIIDLVTFSKIYKLLIFVNLKLFLSDEEVMEIYKYSMYNEINILLLEFGQHVDKLEYENVLLIDDDYIEMKY